MFPKIFFFVYFLKYFYCIGPLADSVSKLQCRSVCLCVYVCLYVCPLALHFSPKGILLFHSLFMSVSDCFSLFLTVFVRFCSFMSFSVSLCLFLSGFCMCLYDSVCFFGLKFFEYFCNFQTLCRYKYIC